MQKNPIYQFEDESSLGIDVVPVDAIVFIQNYNLTGPLQVLKIANSNMNGSSTIADFITNTGNWKQIATPEIAGRIYENSTHYKKGDIVTESGIVYVALIDTQGTLPSPATSSWWVNNIILDPGWL